MNSLRRVMDGMCLHHGPYGHLALISRCCVRVRECVHLPALYELEKKV